MGQTDLAIRLLAEHHLSDLLPALLASHRVEVIAVERSELQVVERLTDQVVRAYVDGVETILHIEFQARHELDLPERVLTYNALLRHRHYPLPVVSIVVYLTPDPPPVPVPRGIHQGQIHFDYLVFLPWEHAIGPDQLTRFPALAPLAALTPGINETNLPEIRGVIEAAPDLSLGQRADLLVLTYFIAGRRFTKDLLTFLLESDIMEESVTYRDLVERKLAEGRAQGLAEGRTLALRGAILKVVEARLGHLPDSLEARLAELDADALDRLHLELVLAQDDAATRAVLARGPH